MVTTGYRGFADYAVRDMTLRSVSLHSPKMYVTLYNNMHYKMILQNFQGILVEPRHTYHIVLVYGFP